MTSEQLDVVKSLPVRLPEELHKRARMLSVSRGESLNGVLVDLLRKWVEFHEKGEKA